MQSEPSSGIKLTAYSCICWLFHRIYYDARNHKHKKQQNRHTKEVTTKNREKEIKEYGKNRKGKKKIIVIIFFVSTPSLVATDYTRRQFSVMICRSPWRRLIQPLENRRGLAELPLTSISHIMYYSRFICMNIGGHGFNSLLANMSVTAITETRRGVASYSITWKNSMFFTPSTLLHAQTQYVPTCNFTYFITLFQLSRSQIVSTPSSQAIYHKF